MRGSTRRSLIRRRLSSSLTFASATEPLDTSTLAAIGLGEGVPFYTTDLPYLWGRTIADGRVIFGAGLVFGAPSDLENADVREGDSGAVLESIAASRARAPSAACRGAILRGMGRADRIQRRYGSAARARIRNILA